MLYNVRWKAGRRCEVYMCMFVCVCVCVSLCVVYEDAIRNTSLRNEAATTNSRLSCTKNRSIRMKDVKHRGPGIYSFLKGIHVPTGVTDAFRDRIVRSLEKQTFSTAASDPAVENICFFGRGGLALKKQTFSTAASDPAVENVCFFGWGGLALKKQTFSTAASDPTVENVCFFGWGGLVLK